MCLPFHLVLHLFTKVKPSINNSKCLHLHVYNHHINHTQGSQTKGRFRMRLRILVSSSSISWLFTKALYKPVSLQVRVSGYPKSYKKVGPYQLQVGVIAPLVGMVTPVTHVQGHLMPFIGVISYNSVYNELVRAHLVWWCLPTSLALQISRGQLLRLSPSPYLDEL